MVWQLNALAGLHWHRWEDDWVVYDESSGQTFLTDTVTAAALMVLESGTATLDQLRAEVERDLSPTDLGVLAEQLRDGLEFLASLGLVEQLSA